MKISKLALITCLALLLGTLVHAQNSKGKYTLVVEGFDWGAAASKVILHMPDSISEVNQRKFKVTVSRNSDCMAADAANTGGSRDIVYAYVSDAEGNHIAKSNHATLILEVGPYIGIDSPIQYFGGGDCDGNQWVDYKVTITATETGEVWNTETDRIIPLVDEFDLEGKFKYSDAITLPYASYKPKNGSEKVPLIIWLHGGGEGGDDPSIILLANRAANYAAPEIQNIFGGTHVLVPQSPTFWMQNADGQYTTGKVNDIYNESLMALIEHYLKNNPEVDPNRIYLGGCSNGGYMTQKLMLLHPNFFAAGFPSALAYWAEFLTDDDIAVLSKQSIWYIHSADDPVTRAEATVIPTYQRLMDAGAADVHLSLYDHVIDLYGLYGGNDFHLNGHFSWVYSHRNHPKKVIDGKELSLMEWLAEKRLK